jgi:3-deoxy-D-manno-octulosonic-acid transferase
MPLLHDLVIGAYHSGIRFAAPWNRKAAAWVNGREGTWDRLRQMAPQLQGCLWMHCASTGEFEQGRPVLESIKKERPDLPVLLTFFSPSGYEARKDLSLATHVEYLPPDHARNAERLQSLIAPRAAIFIKYEFWHHHLQALHEHEVPTYLVSAVFRKEQPFFRWYGGTWRHMLGCFTHIFTQDERSLGLLTGIGMENASVGGDTRFDRVAGIVMRQEGLPMAAAFKGTAPLLVCGSTWPADEHLLARTLSELDDEAPKCIVVPHELHKEQLAETEKRFPRPLALWSELERSGPANIAATLGQVRHGSLVVDRMGLLARLYQYADMAYVGGGFTDGIHNLLEAAAWGVPVIFGPKHRKFAEAQGLIDAEAGIRVNTEGELTATLRSWSSDRGWLERASANAKRYVQQRTGATERVVTAILPQLR